MRIAQVAPLYESVPPTLYGGTERVVSWLTEELVRQGHEVTLFASGDSKTTATLIPACPSALWRDSRYRETLPHHVRLLELVFQDPEAYDIIHFHCDYVHFPLVRRYRLPTVSTMHGAIYLPDLSAILTEYLDVPLVSISDSQRRPLPSAKWIGTVRHGLPLAAHRFSSGPGTYLAFLGRISPEKGLERAIEIACRSGHNLKIAAKIYPEDQTYFERTIEPLLDNNRHFVEFVGEVGGTAKDDFLGGAKALLFPIQWEEPFGLVMIEAMAVGTPVIAWKRGSVPEVITNGRNGYVVDNVEQAVQAVRCLDRISRHECWEEFARRFTAERMANDYVRIYNATMGIA
jgi:glycosyltransferase involved in cell wall biosynthesis